MKNFTEKTEQQYLELSCNLEELEKINEEKMSNQELFGFPAEEKPTGNKEKEDKKKEEKKEE